MHSSHHAQTESVPNVGRLLSAETECLPKVLISPHSAPKPKTETEIRSISREILAGKMTGRGEFLRLVKREAVMNGESGDGADDGLLLYV